MEAIEFGRNHVGLREEQVDCMGVSSGGEIHEDLRYDEEDWLPRQHEGGRQQGAKSESHPRICLRGGSDGDSLSRINKLRLKAGGSGIWRDAARLCREEGIALEDQAG